MRKIITRTLIVSYLIMVLVVGVVIHEAFGGKPAEAVQVVAPVETVVLTITVDPQGHVKLQLPSGRLEELRPGRPVDLHGFKR
jgi:hypothetical protein